MKEIFDPVTPSHTSISSYGCTREESTCCQAPILFRNATDDGVRLLTWLEKFSESRFQLLALVISWLSTRATLSLEVIGEDPKDYILAKCMI